MDRLIRTITKDGSLMAIAADSSDIALVAHQVHHTSPVASAALGRLLTGAALMGALLKGPGSSVTVKMNGGGPLGGIVAVSDCDGNVRGYVGNPATELPLRSDGKLNVGAAVGRDGMFTVSRDIGLREPYIGSVELVSGEIAEDLTAYLLESEQVPSACALGVLVDTDCTVKAAGGFIVQLMPGAEEEIISRLEDNIFMMDQLTTILSEDGEEELFRQVLKGFDYHTVGEHPIEYRCYCSRERVLDALRCVSAEELEEIAAEGKDVSVNCQFCDKVYDFTPGELREINTPEKT